MRKPQELVQVYEVDMNSGRFCYAACDLILVCFKLYSVLVTTVFMMGNPEAALVSLVF